MSRTIRRKGWHVVKSSKWNDQNTNEFAYIRKSPYNTKAHIDKQIKENMERLLEVQDMIRRSSRDGFWKTLRWTRYATPVPRIYHRTEIKRSLKYGDDYQWDESAARKYEKGICMMTWD